MAGFPNLLKDEILPAIFGRAPTGLLQDLTGLVPLVPHYHVVSDQNVPHVKHIGPHKNVRQFKRDLDGLLKSYEPINLRDLVTCMNEGRRIPKNSLLLSFDDGYREHYDVVAPILLEKGVTASFFLTVDFLDNRGLAYSNKASLLLDRIDHMAESCPTGQIATILAKGGIGGDDLKSAIMSIPYSRKEILDQVANILDYDFADYLQRVRPYLTFEQVEKLMEKGFTIGGHTLDHPRYTVITHEEQLRQTFESVRFLRKRFSLDYGAFVFPNGDDDVSDAFFSAIFASGIINVTFGNIGKMRRVPTMHFARLPMDKQTAPIEHVISRYYAKSLYMLVTGRRLRGKRDFRSPCFYTEPTFG